MSQAQSARAQINLGQYLFPGDRYDNRQVGYDQSADFQSAPPNYQNNNQRNYQNAPSYQQPHYAMPRNGPAQRQWNQYENQNSVSQSGYYGPPNGYGPNGYVQENPPRDEMQMADASADQTPVQVRRPVRSVMAGAGAGGIASVTDRGVHRRK